MRKIIIDYNKDRLRAALLENEHLVEFHVEKPSEELVGNIYVGKVVNVLPGMQAAFVDIGIDRNAFLFIADVMMPNNDKDYDNEIEREDININEVLQQGQTVLVQVKKEAFGKKGPRVTTYISIAGRFIVYMPNSNYIGVSKKITDENERDLLKKLGENILKDNEGMIIRTRAMDVNDQYLNDDLKFLRSVWDTILENSKKLSAPNLVYKDLDLSFRLIRDLFSEDVEQFIIDDGYEYARIKEFINKTTPEYVDRLYFYQGKNIFDAYDIQHEIDKLTKRKVWLKSGGYIIIDKTEALTAIDVNTGKYIGHSRLEDTIFKINMEAAVQIAKELRLRDIGGIIIIDFIDMELQEHGDEIISALEMELKNDRTRSSVLGLTQLGLVEMTRKKVRQSIDNVLLRPCPACDGEGKIFSEEEIFDKIKREVFALKEYTIVNVLILVVHPFIADLLNKNEGKLLHTLEEISDKSIKIREDCGVNLNSYRFLFN